MGCRLSLTLTSLHHANCTIQIFEPGFKERSWTYPPVVGRNGYIGSIAAFREAERFGYVDPDTMDVEVRCLSPLISQA